MAFKSQEEVLGKFIAGDPLSCFVKEAGSATVYVAYSGTRRNSVNCMSFRYYTSDLYQQEMGVHFCRFRAIMVENEHLVIEEFNNKNDLSGCIDLHAVMLPYKKDGTFSSQYTLIYHDWEVLLCGRTDGVSKDIPSLQRSLFNCDYIEQISH